jgi:hypothetical protein
MGLLLPILPLIVLLLTLLEFMTSVFITIFGLNDETSRNRLLLHLQGRFMLR